MRVKHTSRHYQDNRRLPKVNPLAIRKKTIQSCNYLLKNRHVCSREFLYCCFVDILSANA